MKNSIFYIFIAIIVFYVWLITFGSFKLLEVMYEDSPAALTLVNGVPYDSLGKSLLEGKATVDRSTILWEVFEVNGKSYMYFGPFPALLRIIPNQLFPELYGRWSRISFLLAASICIISFALIIKYQLNNNYFMSQNDRKFLFNISVATFGFGTPIITLMTQNHIYREAILWGLSMSLCGIYFIVLLISEDSFSFRRLFLLSICCGGALLSRSTFGITMYFALLMILISYLFKDTVDKGVKQNLKFFLSISPALLALGFQFWYNYERFGSITDFYNIKYCPYAKANNYTSAPFSIERAPIALFNYLGIRKEYFLSNPPFITIPFINTFNSNLFYADHDSRVLSLTASSPWLVLGAIVGFIIIFSQNNLLPKLTTLALLPNILLIINYWGMSQRYICEFLPLMVYGYSFCLKEFREINPFGLNVVLFKRIMLTLCVFSIFACIMSSLEWSLTHEADGIFRETILDIFKFLEKLV